MRLTLFTLLLFAFLTTPVWADDYKIGNGDVLEVAVWGVPDMSRTVVVRPDGKITLPAVGDILARDKTPEDLSALLAKEMRVYIKQPIVTVSVDKIKNNRVYVIGGGLSRVIDMETEMTLLKLLSQLGDFSEVDLRKAYVSRNGQKVASDFYSLFFEGDLSKDIDIKAEDVVFMPSNANNRVYVLGAVGGPASLQYREGMTVLDAILSAGGFSDFAKDDSVVIVRKNKEKVRLNIENVLKKQDISANVAVYPGDYVLVHESLF
ncbi:MAG: polysaccharide biosynthesis/export family protein [Saprospiraceae bacterium]|nr:polysaccharide biosynthesis/export family protein [Saprospiraceae bacterium]